MRYHRLLFILVAAITVLCTSATAATITFGPFLDAKGFLPPVQQTVIPTLLQVLIPIPLDGFLPLAIRDRITVTTVGPPFSFIALTWVTASITGVSVGPILGLTDVWAVDLNPNGTAFSATGFDPLNPQLVPISNEEFVGLSGASYPATTSSMATLSGLSGLLPGFDLSAFSGNPDSVVYVFQAEVPLADALVPEPLTLATVAAAILVLLASRRPRGIVRPAAR